MFTQQDVSGIELERLVAYIMQRNKEEKQQKDDIYEAVFDLAGSLHTGFGHVESIRAFSKSGKGKRMGGNDQRDDVVHSIDEIRETDEQRINEYDQFAGQQNQHEGGDGIMLTKPRTPPQPSKKHMQISQKQTPTNKPINPQNSLHHPPPINMKSIMLSLKNHTIDHLKQQFIYNENKITLQRFLYLMKHCISYDPNRQYEIMYELIKLFEEIDIDCNRSIDWEEFLEYLACYGWTSGGLEKGAGRVGDGERANRKDSLVVEVWNEVNKHRKNTLSKIVQIERLGMLCLVESKNFFLSFLNMKGEKYMITNQKDKTANSTEQTQQQQKSPSDALSLTTSTSQNSANKPSSFSPSQSSTTTPFVLNHIDPQKVLSLDYSQHQKLFGILQTDRKVHFVEQGEIQKFWGKVQGIGNEIDIMYLPLHKKWLLKRINQYIDIFASPKDKRDKERIVFKPHETQAITAIKELKQPFSLVTSGIDGKIKIWSLASRQLLIELKPIGQEEIMTMSQVKTKGVKGIDTLNVGIQSYFCSWTFTTEIMLWLPSASVSKPYIGKLQGHSGIVESCEFIKPHHCTKQLLVSMDNKRVVKIWSVEKLECLQSIVHQGHGCKVKCLSSRPVIMVYDKIIQFCRMKLTSLMMGAGTDLPKAQQAQEVEQGQPISKQPFSIKQPNSIPVSKFVQIQFCTHNILILLLTKTQLKVINMQSGRIQAIFEPSFKDEEQFVHMSMKINRRAFVLSSLGHVYYIKLDDASLIKRFQIVLGSKETERDLSKSGLRQGGMSPTINSKLKTYNIDESPQKNSSISTFQKPSNPSTPVPFTSKFVYYHSQSKMLLVIVELDSEQSSILLTYDEATGYEFQKMKEIEFPQIDLTHMFFFTKCDAILLANDSFITVWDWTKLNIVNKLDLTTLPFNQKSKQFYLQHHTQSQSSQPPVKHLLINQTNNANCLLLMILTKFDDFLLYELQELDFSFKQCVMLELPPKLRLSAKGFYFLCTLNQDIEALVSAKLAVKKSRKNILHKEKQVKFNFSVDDEHNEGNPQAGTNNSRKDEESHHPPNKTSVVKPSIPRAHTNNHHGAHPSSLVTKSNRNSQQNLFLNPTKQSKILYLTTKQGIIFGYHIHQIINVLKRQGQLGQVTGDGKRLLERNFNLVSSFAMNLDQNIDKRYAAHKIRETRKATIRQLLNQVNVIGPIEIQDNILIERELISTSWTNTFSQIYTDLMYGLSEKNELIFFKPTGQPLGEWSLKSMVPKRWDISYQILPKVLQRLNRLQEIINFYKQSSKQLSSKIVSRKNNEQGQNEADLNKVLFLANRYLQEPDLMELREYVKLSTVKLLNLSKKNILYKKNLAEEKSKEVVSMKKLDEFFQGKSSSNKKKSVTISKKVMEYNIDDNVNGSPSMSKVKRKNSNNLGSQQSNPRLTGYELSSFGAKKKSQNDKQTNFFERKFEQKVEQENRIKIHRKYIDKQIEKTLKQAKTLQLKRTQSQPQNIRPSIQQQLQNTQKSISKKVANDKKEHAKNLISQTPLHLGQETPSGKVLLGSQVNHLMLEQEMQRKEIEKNIDFVKRIQQSIEKVQMAYAMGRGFNFIDLTQGESKKGVQKVNDKKKFVKSSNSNDQKPQDTLQQKNQQSNAVNLLKANEPTQYERKISISNKMVPENTTQSNIQNEPSEKATLITKSTYKVNEPSMRLIRDSNTRNPKQVNVQVQVTPNGMVGNKKNVDFANSNKVVVYDGNDGGSDLTNKSLFRDTTTKLVKKSPARSFSAVNKPSVQQSPNNTHHPTAANSPSRTQLRSASNYNSQQRKPLTKSRSLYGTEFVRQKEMAMSSFKQGMRDFENFYKRFGSGLGSDASKTNKKSRIKLG